MILNAPSSCLHFNPSCCSPSRTLWESCGQVLPRRDISGADSICLVFMRQSRESRSFFLVSQMVLGLFGPEWIRLWLKFSGEHDLYLHNRYKVYTVSIWCLEYLIEFKSFIEPAFTKCRVSITQGLSFCDLFMICQGLTRSLSYYQMSVCSLENSVKVAYNVHQTHPSHWQA